MDKKTVAIGVDHGGLLLKSALIEQLGELGCSVCDLGAFGPESVDYPDYAYKVAEALRVGAADIGLVVCGTGIGMSIAMNRYPWIRAGLAHDVTSARLSREHNDANVLALGARMIGAELAKECLTVFLQTEFGEGRHARRVRKLTEPPNLGDASNPA
ncbi:MAG: ribose 5-phosphate isomerase B [Proteobacteria bacterium]|nr:ribose 5-phosphate isomerase B [Pseudomonadota bacterium]